MNWLFISALALMALSTLKLAICAPSDNPVRNFRKMENCFYQDTVWTRYPDDDCHNIVNPSSSALKIDPRWAQLNDMFKNYLAFVREEFKLLLECYRSDVGVGLHACMKPIRELALKREINVGSGNQIWLLDEMWKHIRTYSDVELVKHCFLFHQRDANPECKGISWNRHVPFANWLREQGIRKEWLKQEKIRDETLHWISNYIDLNEAQIKFCLYNMRWRINATADIRTEYNVHWGNATGADICYLVANPDPVENFPHHEDRQYHDHVYILRKKYRHQVRRDLVTDCIRYHSDDRAPWCEKVSWSQSKPGKDFKAKDSIYKKLYRIVKKKMLADEKEEKPELKSLGPVFKQVVVDQF